MQGLRNNWKQFVLLVIVNAFVGGMIGLERTIFPAFANQQFGISSHTAVLSFIAAFGFSKALTNYFTGKLANRLGRKQLLILGWAFSLPIPFLLMYAQSWNWVIFSNLLLGISQGLTWSSTVVMKIDLVGNKDRGLAMGLNEFAGYFAVGLMAFLSGYVADHYGVTPYPFYLGIVISVLGFLLSLIWVKETHHFAITEHASSEAPVLKRVFIETSFTNKTLSSVTQAGLINNLNDGMIWGLLPMLLASLFFSIHDIGIVTALYPMVWGLGQLFTGKMSDVYSKKEMLFWGMLLQGIAIVCLILTQSLFVFICLSIVLGLGTALVYPTFLNVIAATTSPMQRAEAIGVFRLWRDLGYAIGAIVSGITADYFGISYAVLSIGVLTVISSVVIRFRMPSK